MDLLNDLINLIKDGGWIAVVGFGIFLAYKISMTSIISYSLVKIVTKVIDAYHRETDRQEALRAKTTTP